MQKSKVFSKKLIALALAVVMAVSSFFGVVSTAFAYQNGDYHDTSSNIGANVLAWVEATDDATLEAALDQLDDFLATADWDSFQKSIDAIGIESKLPSQVVSLLGLSLTFALPQVSVKTTSLITINVNANVSSVDGIIDTFFQLKGVLQTVEDNKSALSILNYNLDGILAISFDTFGNYFHDSASSTREQGYRTSSGSWRDRNSAKYIIRGVLRWLLQDNQSLINNLLSGDLSLVTDKNGDLINVYDIIGGLVGIDYDAWKDASNGTAYNKSSNGFIYNILKAVLVKFVPLYEGTDHLKEEGSAWVYDNELWKIANFYLQKLSFEITYPEYATFSAADKLSHESDANGEPIYLDGRFNDSSKRRYLQAKAAGKFNTSTGMIDATYAEAQGWDANLVYSQEEGYEGNVLVAKYGSETVSVTSNDTVYSVIWKALPIVWKTALKPTIELLHVNYDGNDLGSGTNFDNHFYYWVNEEYQNGNYTWVRGANYKNNYSDTIINAWAADVYTDYNFASANEFLAYVKKTLTFNKTRLAKNEKYNWRDIDASILFAEIRFSPLADHWGIQTGPLNLYFSQTGAPAVIDFFDTLFASKTAAGFPGSLMSQLDNALVTAMADLFPNSENIGKATADAEGAYDGVESTSMPALSTTDSTAVATVVDTLIGDAATVFKYAADATDLNILNPFYHSDFADNGDATIITQDNIEQAVIPFAISALKHWNITASIHNSDWDKVCDIESMAVVALQEYLKYAYPERDYSDLYVLSEPMELAEGVSYKFINAVDGTTLLDHAIMPMAADALTFVLTAAGMPFWQQQEGSGACSYSGATIKPLEYTFVGKGEGLDNLFWKTLNATVCYFGVEKKIAALANAPTAISTSNDIWTNANNVVNTLLPAFNRLLGGNTGAFNIKDFLWRDVVLSVADISGTKGYKADYDGTTTKGFSAVFTIIGNLLTAPILNNVTVFNAVIFEIAKPLINLILGARSGSADIIRVTASTSNPLNTFLTKDNINTSINNLLANLYGITNGTTRSGGNDSTLATASANSIHAAAFILTATQILPKLRDNTVGGVSATLADHVVSTTSFKTRLAIRNESWGLNDFYKDTANANVEAGRYYATLKSVKIIRTSTNADVTSSFSISPNAKNSDNRMPQGTNYVTLDPEGFTRLDIQGTNTPADVYRVEVTYDMTRKDDITKTTSVTYSNAKAIDFFSASASTAGDVAWTDAFSGNYATNTAEAQAAGLTTKATSGTLDVYGPTLIVTGSNAGGCGYGYTVENRQNAYDSNGDATGYTGTTAHINYATVAANTTGYKLKSGSASTAANANAAWVAVDLDGNAIKGDGSTVTVASALASDGIGYIQDSEGNYVALSVATGKIGTTASTYRAGTSMAGVYLDTESFHIDGRNDKNNTNGSAGHRIVASDSASGLEAAYNKVVINTTVGSFPLTIATGNIDSNYAALRDTSTGLAAHYFTSTTPEEAVNALILPAMTKTLASGVNLDNLANSLDTEAEVKALREAAYANPTQELTDVVNMVIKARRERSNVNYVLVANYEEAVKKAKDVEALISLDYQYEKDGNGDYVVDENGDWVKIYESGEGVIPGRYHAANYLSYSPCIVLQEGARVFSSVYMPQAVMRTTGVFDLLYDEITHATSSTDEYDVLGPNAAGEEFTNDKDTFTADVVGTDYHQFPYTTKDEGEWDGVQTYIVSGSEEGLPVKFGAMVYNEESDAILLSNLRLDEETGEYVQAYTEDSWQAYVNALGECLDVASRRDGDSQKNVHNAYQARSHLVICENNLEIYDGEEETPVDPGEDTITVSGKVVIANSLDGESGEDGIVGIDVYADLNDAPVATTAADGTFTATVPAGTTSLYFTNHAFANGVIDSANDEGCTIDRTVTLSGTADVTGAVIPIIVCDYNGDGAVSAADSQTFSRAMGAKTTSANYNVYCNLNADGSVSAADKQIYNKFLGKVRKNYTYQAKSLD